MTNNCPSVEKCPIFTGLLKDKSMTTKSYQSQFCTAGTSKYTACKRFMTKNKYGICPPDLLPNCTLDLDQIAAKYKLVLN